MSTGSTSDPEELLELRVLGLQYPGVSRGRGTHCQSLLMSPGGGGSSEDEEEDELLEDIPGGSGMRRSSARRRQGKECKQTQRNAANARERARMRVLSKAFSRLKTSLPWVPADTKLSKLDTLRLASSYIQHLRQLLQEDRYHQGVYMHHPANLAWPFVVSGRPESEVKDGCSGGILCGTTA
ncbi:musculin [Ambystoma mexicanum]|uniref:musculin n=1 Tax=Ambystoma mexicanum TaxID=8296 RepID=UPI0037E93393